MKKIIFIVFAIILFLSVVQAQKETPPEGGTPKDFNLPQKTEFELGNGLAVTLVPYGTLPKVNVSFKIRVGNLNENEDQVWLADLTADFLKEGTKTRTARQIAEDAAQIGGEINTSTGMDQTTISGEALAEFAPQLIEILADILLNPGFPEPELDRLQKNYLRQLSVQKSQPQTQALDRFRTILYSTHPYGRIFPTEEMINSYDIEKVRSFFEQNFNAKRTHLYVVGMFDQSEVRSKIEDLLSDWKSGQDFVENIPQPQSKKEVYLVNRPDAAQSSIIMGLPVLDPSHDDYIAMQVTNTLLGGFFSSRITSNIREDKGYTYSPNSTVSSRYRDAYWAQTASVSTDVTGASLKEIFYEIDRLQGEAPSKEELDGIKNYMAGIFVLQNSSRNGIISRLSFQKLHKLGDDYLSNYVKRIYQVTPQDVERIAQEYIRDDDMTVVIVGDVAKIKKQVKPYGKLIM